MRSILVLVNARSFEANGLVLLIDGHVSALYRKTVGYFQTVLAGTDERNLFAGILIQMPGIVPGLGHDVLLHAEQIGHHGRSAGGHDDRIGIQIGAPHW